MKLLAPIVALMLGLTLTGATWPETTIYVADRAPAGWPVHKAVEDWDRAAGVRVIFVYRCKDRSPCIPVREEALGGDAAGVAYLTWTGDTLLDANIAVDRDWHGAEWAYRKNIVLHESGHGLGLEHRPNNPRSVLYPYITTRTTPSAGDLRRLEALYAR